MPKDCQRFHSIHVNSMLKRIGDFDCLYLQILHTEFMNL